MSKYPFNKTCIHCDNDFEVKSIHEKPKRYCGKSCATSHTNSLRQSKYPFERACLGCGNTILIESKHFSGRTYCSRKCAAVANNAKRSPESRHAQAITMREKCGTHTKACIICEGYIEQSTKKVCNSTDCRTKYRLQLNEDKAVRMKAFRVKREAEHGPDYWSKIGHKGGQRAAATRPRRSKDEIALYDLCVGHFERVEHNVPLVDGWDADIIIHDEKIAVLWNGPWHYRDMDMTNHSLLQVQTRDRLKKAALEREGWKVMIFEDRSYTPQTAFEEIIR